MSDQFQHVAVELIDEDVSNHRIVTDEVADQALRASISEKGIQQPVRLTRKADGRYTLVFGFRRTAAARALGLETVPAMVMESLSVSDIRALQAIENIERKDLHPLEEAQFCNDLYEVLQDGVVGGDGVPAEIARRIGRDRKWVENRLSLARLSPRVKQAFLDGDIHLAHALLIARLVSFEAQEEVLGSVRGGVPAYVMGKNRQEARKGPESIAFTRGLVEARLRDLSKVTWKLDAAFDGKPSCAICVHNSANRLELFDGDEPKKATCLNAECFEEKRKFAQRAVSRATNTLLKKTDEPTAPLAREAIKEREVEFLQPRVVVAAAKARAEKEGSQPKKSAAERRGENSWERQNKINSLFAERFDAWRAPLLKEVNRHLPLEDAYGIAMVILIRMTVVDYVDAQWGDKSRRETARALLPKAIALLKSPSADSLGQLAELIRGLALKELDADDPLEMDSYNDRSFALGAFLEAFGIPTTEPKPTREAIERELYPPAEKGPKKKVARKKGKA